MLYFWEEFLNKYGSRYLHNYGGQYLVELVVDNGCGQSQTITQSISVNECEDDIHRSIRIDPNPANTDIGIYLFSRTPGVESFNETLVDMNKPDGYSLSVKRSDGGPNVINTKIFNNGERINILSLPNGYYNLQLEFSPSEVLTRTFIIINIVNN